MRGGGGGGSFHLLVKYALEEKKERRKKTLLRSLNAAEKKFFPLFFSFPLLPPLSAPRYMGKRGEKEKKRETWIWGKKKREMAEQYIPYFPLLASRLGKNYRREKRECAFAHCCVYVIWPAAAAATQ